LAELRRLTVVGAHASATRSSGGKKGVEYRREASWRKKCVAAARADLAAGGSVRGLPTRMAKKYDKDRTTVSRLLKAEGVI
jgi:hypothetical protein